MTNSRLFILNNLKWTPPHRVEEFSSESVYLLESSNSTTAPPRFTIKSGSILLKETPIKKDGAIYAFKNSDLALKMRAEFLKKGIVSQHPKIPELLIFVQDSPEPYAISTIARIVAARDVSANESDLTPTGPKLVSNLDEIEDNVRRFQDVLLKNESNYTVANISLFSHWYYFPNSDSFAPSKFIGYVGTNVENYDGKGTGSRTEAVLNKYFEKLNPKTERYIELEEKLLAFVHSIGRGDISRKFYSTGGIHVQASLLKKYDDSLLDFSDTQKDILTKARRKQGEFRRRLLINNPTCPITGISDPQFLVASHIIPWSACINAQDQISDQNGIMLATHIDHLFDKGFITFNKVGTVEVSNMLRPEIIHQLNIGEQLLRAQLDSLKASSKYMDFHRKYVFKRGRPSE